jgi:predicted transcriptional regulator
MRRSFALLCVALLLAGCGSLAGEEATETATDGVETVSSETKATGTTAENASVTHQPGREPARSTAENASVTHPPGVGPDGFTNLTRLEEANRNALLRSGHVVFGSYDRLENGTRINGFVVHSASGSGGYPYVNRTQEISDDETVRYTARWANESVAVHRVEPSGVWYQGLSDPAPANVSFQQLHLFATLRGGDWTVSAASEGSVTLTATGADSAWADDTVRYEGRVVVAADGVVRSANVTSIRVSNETVMTERVRYELRDRGRERVIRPTWAQQRAALVPNLSVDATALNDRFVRVENHGDPILAGSALSLRYRGCEYAERRLRESIQTGETVFVYIASREDNELGINRSGPAGPADVIELPAGFYLLFDPPSGAYDVHPSDTVFDVNTSSAAEFGDGTTTLSVRC